MKKINIKSIKIWKRGFDEKSLKSEGVDLNKQWRRAFTLFVIVMLALVVFEIRMFFRIDQDSIFTSVSPQSVEVENIDRSEILRVLEYYENKDREFNSLVSSRLNFPSPEESTGVVATTTGQIEE